MLGGPVHVPCIKITVFLGDIDGVLVIPAAVVDEVIESAESLREREDIVRSAQQEGGNIRALFEKYRVF